MSYNRIFLLVGLLALRCELRSSYLGNAIPKYCILGLDPGICGQSLVHYYFDMQTRRCEPFFYNGCESIGNNFETISQCIEECHLFAQKARELNQPDIIPKRCTIPKENGHCKKRYRYYYNPTMKKCERFIYSGCGGNANNFVNIMDCIKECKLFDMGPERLG